MIALKVNLILQIKSLNYHLFIHFTSRKKSKVLETIAKEFINLYAAIKERNFSVAEFDILVSYLAPADPRIKIREDEKFDAEHAINKHFLLLKSLNYDKGANNPNKLLFKYTGKVGKK